MKREVVLLVFGMFLMGVMIGGVSAECQYKDYIYSSEEKIVFYENGTRLNDTLLIAKDFVQAGGCGNWGCGAHAEFKVYNYYIKQIIVDVFFINLGKLDNESITVDSRGYTKITRSWTDYIDWDTIYFVIKNDNIEARREKVNVVINQSCKQCLDRDCLNDGQNCTYDFECGSNVCSQTGNTKGFCISQRSDLELKIASIEANMTLLQSWKQTITDTITSIFDTLIGHNTKISKLENQTSSTPNYFKYLGGSDRKAIVCGYAQDNHLTSINDLGFNCTIKYTLLRYGGEKAYCKCVGK